MHNKYAITGALIALILTAAAVPFRSASAAGCEFKNELEKLSKAQTASATIDSAENVRGELAIRKDILNKAIDCSINDASELKSGIASAQVNYPHLRDAQNRLLVKIDELIRYYRAQKNSVNDLGIEGSKNFSASLKTWRDSNYLPIADISKNFLVFARNQDLLQTTQSRFDHTNLTLKTLGLDGNQKIGELLDQARKNLSAADRDNAKAIDEFKRLAWPNDIYDLMVSSLQSLKDTYQNFFDIGTAVQDAISAR